MTGRKTPIRRSRFTLRTLMCAVILFAVLFAWVRIQESRRNAIVDEIERLNGSVEFGASSMLTVFPTLQIEAVSLPYDSLNDFDATKLRRFPRLTKMELTNFNATNGSGTRFHADKLTFDAALHGDFLSRFEPDAETPGGR